MANGGTHLYDLRVAIAGPVGGACHVVCTLEQRWPYPPAPRLTAAGAGYADETVTMGVAEADLPAALLTAATLPAALEGPAILRDRAALDALLAPWTPDIVAERMRAVTAGLFAGPAGDLLAQLLAACPAPGSNFPWDLPPAVGRITLEVADPALRRIPWEQMALAGPGGELWRRCAIVRRGGDLPPAHAVAPFRLPLNIGVDRLAAPTAHAAGAAGWADALLASPDQFVARVRAQGGVTWAETPGAGAAAGLHIRHLVYNSAEMPVETFPVRLPVRGGGFVSIGGGAAPTGWEQALQVLSPPVLRGGPLAAPRLLALHGVGGGPAAHLLAPLLTSGLATGADAVLLVTTADADPAAGGFWPIFYRKILHNWPLDLCVAAGLHAALRQGRLPTGWALAVRPEGELRLLLTRAVVEGVANAMPATKGGRGPTRGGEMFPLPPTSGGGGSRSERAQADLQAQFDRALTIAQDDLVRHVDDLAHLQFGSEEHDVGRIVQGQDDAAAAARAVTAGAQAEARLKGLDADTLQRAGARMTNLWLSEERAGQPRTIGPRSALTTGQSYTLHLKIGPLEAHSLLRAGFPEEALQQVFERHDKVRLEVAFFSPPTDFTLAAGRAVLTLPRIGVSNEVQVQVTPAGAGTRRLRACIYYRNVLLQSVLLQATVVEPGAGRAPGALLARTMDYIASADLALLDELPSPAVSIFTNDGADGTHWIGVFDAAGQTRLPLRSGEMRTYGATELTALAERSRDLLAEIEGKTAYRMATLPMPLDAQGGLAPSADVLNRRSRDMVRLAVEGWRLFDKLFVSRLDADRQRTQLFDASLNAPGIVSVARCRGDAATIPWAALYRLPLDTGKEAEMQLCPLFTAQLAANRWTADAGAPPESFRLTETHDLLDQPQVCRAQAQCPLNDPDTGERTVCPFGFWGFLHQVEQPLQQMQPTPLDQPPPEVAAGRFNQTSFLVQRDGVHMGLGIYPGFADADLHRQELADLGPLLHIEAQTDRDAVLALLRGGGQQLYYLFCHGEIRDNEFRLKLGPVNPPGYLSAADLNPARFRWLQGDEQPLVILNGCETMALTPELIHGFLGKLRFLGASGVVGTEVKVFTELARPVGRLLLGYLLEGLSIGEAFLALRLRLLRQYNPLGLAYTCHAPATLHLHSADCAWCRAHGVGV